MLNRWASLTMSTRVLKALPGKIDKKRLSPNILYITNSNNVNIYTNWHSTDTYKFIIWSTFTCGGALHTLINDDNKVSVVPGDTVLKYT